MAVTQSHLDPHPSKLTRLEAHVSSELKSLLLKAALLTGRTLSDFVVTSAIEVATRTVREHEVMTLSLRDRKAFVSALLKPPAPGPRLRTAVSRDKRRPNVG